MVIIECRFTWSWSSYSMMIVSCCLSKSATVYDTQVFSEKRHSFRLLSSWQLSQSKYVTYILSATYTYVLHAQFRLRLRLLPGPHSKVNKRICLSVLCRLQGFSESFSKDGSIDAAAALVCRERVQPRINHGNNSTKIAAMENQFKTTVWRSSHKSCAALGVFTSCIHPRMQLCKTAHIRSAPSSGPEQTRFV